MNVLIAKVNIRGIGGQIPKGTQFVIQAKSVSTAVGKIVGTNKHVQFKLDEYEYEKDYVEVS